MLTQPTQPSALQSETLGDTDLTVDGSEARGREFLVNWRVSSDDPKQKAKILMLRYRWTLTTQPGSGVREACCGGCPWARPGGGKRSPEIKIKAKPLQNSKLGIASRPTVRRMDGGMTGKKAAVSNE